MTKSKETNGFRQRTHNGIDKVMDKAESMNQSSRKMMTRVKDNAIRVSGNVDGYIKKNPKKSVLIATGVGLAAGAASVALMRKKHKNP